MKTTNNPTFKLFLICLIFAAVVAGPQLAAAQLQRVAVVPFKINAEKDLSFLRDGIVDMLTSRLSQEDRVAVLSRDETAKVLENVQAPLNESKAREIGTRLKVDYVLFGSLTVFGNSVSIDAKMVDVAGKNPPLTFFNQSQGMDPVISQINLFATDINAKIFGRDMPASRIYARPQTPPEQIDARTHPEKMFSGGYSDAETGVQQSTLNPAFVTTAGTRSGSREFWKSRNFNFLINGLAIGDVDGDGKIETVIAAPHAVYIYRAENNRFYKTQELPQSRNRNIIGVDVADINGNGTPEIFVTSLNAHKNAMRSFVLEYDGKNYNEIVKDHAWYYRVIEHPSRGSILFGQKQRTGGADPFSEAIFEMTWEGSGYQPGNQILPPGRANLMGFAYGNVLNDGQALALAYNDKDYFRIFNASGKEEWKGAKQYGGGTLYLATPQSSPGEGEGRRYLPMRIRVMDINTDGKTEAIAVKNTEVAGRHLERFRKFTNSQIEALSWNGLGLITNWKTREITGFIRDFVVGDFDHDGRDELIAAVISQEGTLVGTTPKSAVIAYELNR